MESRTDERVPAGVFAGIGLAAAAWLALVLGLMALAPRFQGTFADFGMQLPALTALTLAAAELAVRFWPLALGAVMLLMVVAAGAIVMLYRERTTRGLAWALLVALLAVPLFAGGCAAVSLQLAMSRLQEGLSR